MSIEKIDEKETGDLLYAGINRFGWSDGYKSFAAEELFHKHSFIHFSLTPNEYSIENLNDDNPNDSIRLKAIYCAMFLCLKLDRGTKYTVEEICNENLQADQKLELISEYFNGMNYNSDDPVFDNLINYLGYLSRTHTVFLSDDLCFDPCQYAWRTFEIIKSYSREAVFLSYTGWRITKEKRNFKYFLSITDSYFKNYFAILNKKSPEMGLDQTLSDLIIPKKIEIIIKWIKYITDHAEPSFAALHENRIIFQNDFLFDDCIINPAPSIFNIWNIMQDDPGAGEDRAYFLTSAYTCYMVWLKTADIVAIFCDMLRILNGYSDAELKKYHFYRKEIADKYEDFSELKDRYLKIFLDHKTFYSQERRKYDSSIMEEHENSAKQANEIIENNLRLTSKFISDDIDDLMLEKQKYLEKYSGLMTEVQVSDLDELTNKVVEKIKQKIRETAIYDEIFDRIFQTFSEYMSKWSKLSQIIPSLSSAECLYQQYIIEKDPIENFDYSCISIMYYMALEDLINKFIYIPYANDILTPNIKAVTSKDTMSLYVTDKKYFLLYGQPKKSCELGPLSKLLMAVEETEKFKEYLVSKYKGVDIDAIKSFGIKLSKISSKRNDAAHGGTIITYEVAREDKENVYNESDQDQVKGLFYELIALLTHES